MTDMPDADGVVVHNNAELEQFEIRQGAQLARLAYDLDQGAIELIHTEVPKELEGHGLARELAHAALEYAKEHKLRVVPSCPFVRAYIKRHPQYRSLVDNG